MPPSQVLYFDNIGYVFISRFATVLTVWLHRQGSNVTTQFTPVLSAYVTSQYQQTEILRGAIQTAEIWKEDLSPLKETTTLIFARNKVTGQYTLTIAGSV
ncbi:hypothetical protein FRB91_004887 [Serendipita sp. 411]|nr:hypothetical protein FRB91_004887 [Serendipita sp. 411]